MLFRYLQNLVYFSVRVQQDAMSVKGRLGWILGKVLASTALLKVCEWEEHMDSHGKQKSGRKRHPPVAHKAGFLSPGNRGWLGEYRDEQSSQGGSRASPQSSFPSVSALKAGLDHKQDHLR